MIRYIYLILFVLTSSSVLADAASEEGEPFDRLIVGSWKFYQVFYDGNKRPPFNLDLQLYFQFNDDGQSRLYYYRTTESGFCERKGHYYIEGAELVDRVTWVNPKNAVGCGQDPDMRMGNETRTRINFVDTDFYLYLSLKGEPLIYIWKPVSSDEINP